MSHPHRPWVVLTAVLAVAVLATHLYLKAFRPEYLAPGGAVRLWCAVTGGLCVISAGYLIAQRRSPLLKGRLNPKRSVWFRAHIWLGLLAGVFFLCHTDFHLGGACETALWIAYGVVVLTGLAGYLIQRLLPPLIAELFPDPLAADGSYHEPWTVPARRWLRTPRYEPAVAICRQLRHRADAVVERLCGPLVPALAAGDPAGLLSDRDIQDRLIAFHRQTLRPYLTAPARPRDSLGDALAARQQFALLRVLAGSSEAAAAIDELERLCDLRRRLARRERLHARLQLWLVIHLPAAFLMLALLVVHVIVALGFDSPLPVGVPP
jgi:hypothetical protein